MQYMSRSAPHSPCMRHTHVYVHTTTPLTLPAWDTRTCTYTPQPPKPLSTNLKQSMSGVGVVVTVVPELSQLPELLWPLDESLMRRQLVMFGECILTGNRTDDFFPGWTERLSPLTSPNSGPPEDVSTRTKMINWLVIKPWLRPED